MQSYFIRRLLKVCDNNVSQAKQELRWITQHVLNQTKNNYYNCNNIQQLDEKEKQTIALMVNDRVEKYKPLQYILGTQPFCDLEIITKPPVLIPSRWETEEWTNRLITKINSRIFSKNQKGIKNNNDINRNGYLDRAEGKQIEILDICTGSGCIALALASNLPDNTCKVYGIDLSVEALELANLNLRQQQQLKNFVDFSKLDILNDEDEKIKRFVKEKSLNGLGFNLIVSNPPYITYEEYEDLIPDVKLWEDKIALVTKIIDELNKNGFRWYEVWKDSRGIDRCVAARLQ
ncbi:5894_t:CDS:2 [Entrophospora sp. SA101]|nr:5894_t:CDS:2 [Entrophospora sp. SA101]